MYKNKYGDIVKPTFWGSDDPKTDISTQFKPNLCTIIMLTVPYCV